MTKKEEERIEKLIKSSADTLNISVKEFKDEYEKQLNKLIEKNTQEGTIVDPETNKERPYTVKEQAVSMTTTVFKAGDKGATSVLCYLDNQSEPRLTSRKTMFTTLRLICQVGNNKEFFHGIQQVDGCVSISANHWSSTIFDLKRFYVAKLGRKPPGEGYTSPKWDVNTLDKTDKTFDIPEFPDNYVNFKILTAFEPGEFTRALDDGAREKVMSKFEPEKPLIKRNFDVLVQRNNGQKEILSVSTFQPKWLNLNVDYNKTYSGSIVKKVTDKGIFWNLVSSNPVESNDNITIDGVTTETAMDFQNIRDHLNKFVYFPQVIGGAEFKIKLYPEQDKKTVFCTVTDIYGTSMTILSSNVDLFKKVTGDSNTLPSLVRILGRPYYDKNRDSIAITAFSINEASNANKAGSVKIDESRNVW